MDVTVLTILVCIHDVFQHFVVETLNQLGVAVSGTTLKSDVIGLYNF